MRWLCHRLMQSIRRAGRVVMAHPPRFFQEIAIMPRHCLIVEAIALIAHDLALTAQEYGLSPVVVSDEAEALSWLTGNAGAVISLAFIHQSASVFSECALHRELFGKKVRVVLMGSEASNAPEAMQWPVLDWPFTTDHVTALLESLGARRLGSCNP